MRLLSLFSGIGAPEKALKKLGIEYELVGFSEIDKYASKAYCAIHDVDESLNLGDITKIDEQALPEDVDLVCYGFPCQDISVAGKGRGLFNEDGTQTRSGLFFDALRIIEATQPRVAIAENVKNLTGKKLKTQFGIILKCLEAAGYNNYWQVLNAKDYGIPQNRERVFIVSIRKDIDDGNFEFPKPFPLELRLKDMLEEQVDEKFYLKECNFSNLIRKPSGDDVKCEGYVAGVTGRFGRHQSNTVYSAKGLCPAQYAVQYKDPFKLLVEDNEPFCAASRGRNPENPSDRTTGAPTQQRLEANAQGVCNTLTTVQKDNYVVEPTMQNLRIRKLTPKECYRLMGFDDNDHDRAATVVSNSQLYKQAGNSIVVDVLEHLFKNIKEITYEDIQNQKAQHYMVCSENDCDCDCGSDCTCHDGERKRAGFRAVRRMLHRK